MFMNSANMQLNKKRKWLLLQEDDIASDYLSALLARQLDEVEDAELLVSRVLFSSWQDKKYWLETINSEVKEQQQNSSETSGIDC